MSKTNEVTILKNDSGNYYIELSQELCEQLGLSEDAEYDLVIVGNGIEFRRR